MLKSRSGFALTAALSLSFGLALPVTVPAADDIAEIVVTSRRIEERLQDVPLAISAFDESTIESAGIADLRDIANLTPGLQFYNALGEALPTPFIRGVAPTDIRAKENNVAVFVDGVYVSGREGLNFSQLDLERIEVVKGPQSALYGRNAFSGAINFITKRPSEVFEAKTALTGGNRGKLTASGSVSGPLIEGVLRGRAGLSYDDWDGSYDDPLNGQDVGGHQYRTAQGSLLFTPTGSVEILGQVYYSDDEIDDSTTTAVQANCEDTSLTNPRLQNDDGVPYGSPIYSNYCGEVPSMSGNEIPKTNGATGETRELFRASLNVDWDIGVGTISALTGYSTTTQDANLDFSRLGDSVPFVYCIGGWFTFCNNNLQPTPLKRFFTGVIDRESGDDSREFSQELRFTSPVDQPFRYSGGVYFYDVRDEEGAGQPLLTGALPDDLDPANLNGGFCPCLGEGFAPGTYLAPFGNLLFITDPGYANDQDESVTKTSSWAVFASVEQDFLESWTARGEVRFTEEKKDYSQWIVPNLLYEDGGVYVPRVVPPTVIDDSWNWVSGRVTLDYKPNDNWMIYTSLANASRSGGFKGETVSFLDPDTQQEGPDLQIIEPYDPEKNWTVEVGIKGRTSDGRIGIDLSAYRIDWQDIVLPQVLTEYVDPTDGVLKRTSELLSLSRNTGDATVVGWELQTDVVISDGWTANVGVSYTDSVWDKARQATYQFLPSFYVPNPDPDGVPLGGDISGHQMLRVAPWTVNASLQYRHEISNDWSFYGRSDITWKDSWYVGNDNQSTVPASTFVNLRLGIESESYTVELWVNNLFDYSDPIGAFRDIFWTNTQDLQSANDPPTSTLADFPPIRLSLNQPSLRTYGITGRVRFGGARQ